VNDTSENRINNGAEQMAKYSDLILRKNIKIPLSDTELDEKLGELVSECSMNSLLFFLI